MTRSRKTEYIINNARLSNQLTIKTANRDNTSNDRSMNLQLNNNTMFNYHMTRNKKDDNILNNTLTITCKRFQRQQQNTGINNVLQTQQETHYFSFKIFSLQTIWKYDTLCSKQSADIFQNHLNSNSFPKRKTELLESQ
jgi:hypothetical protein